MSTLKKAALSAAIAAFCASTTTMANEAGDILLRMGAAGVYPTGESDDLAAVPGGQVEADETWSLGITFTYMFTDQIGVGVLGAWPFSHDIQPKGNLKNITSQDIADTKQLPPTVTLQWHIPTSSNFHPFIGAGFNYTYFFDEDTKNDLSDASIDIDNSWGFAAEAGVDYVMDNDWMVSGQVWYIGIEPDAEVQGGALGLDEDLEVEIDPWVFMVSVGKKF